MQHVINASDGTMVIAGKTVSRVIEPKGHKMLHRHDLLWTGRQACYAAFRERALTPTHTISCTPGTEAITEKSAFVSTLNDAYGPAAASSVMPTAFLLPQQYNEFANHIYNTHATGNWALKEDVHRGKGVVAASGRRVLSQALEKIELQKKGPNPYRFVMVQRFIDDQMLIHNRPFVLRLWASFAGGSPLFRSYLYSGGIAIFGTEHQPKKTVNSLDSSNNNTESSGWSIKKSNKNSAQQQEKEEKEEKEEQRVQNLVVNIFQQNRSAAIDPWTVSDIKAHMHTQTGSDDAFHTLWTVVEKSTAAALAAAVPSVRKKLSSSLFKRYQGGNVELLGLDFVVDSSMRPWLVEVNYLPSMARKVIDCVPPAAASATVEKPEKKESGNKQEVCRENPMDLEKEGFLRAYLRVFAARHSKLESHITAAQEAVESRKIKNKNSTISAEFLQQILDAENEWEAAQENGFSDLSGYIYESLECLQTGNTAACAAALPPLPASLQKISAAAAVEANLGFTQKLQLYLQWSMAQVRRVGLFMDHVLKVLGGPRGRPSPPPPRYVALHQDAVIKAWLQLPVEERRSKVENDGERVLEKLCALEASISAVTKGKSDKNDSVAPKDEL